MEPTSPCVSCQGQPTPPPCYTCTFRLKQLPPDYNILANNNSTTDYSIGQPNYTSISSTWHHNNTLTAPTATYNDHLNNYSMQGQHVMCDSHSNMHQNITYDDPFSNEVTMLTERLSIQETGAQHSQDPSIRSWNNGFAHNIQLSLEVPHSRRRNPSGNQLLLSALAPPDEYITALANSQHHFPDHTGGQESPLHSSRIGSTLPSQGIIPY